MYPMVKKISYTFQEVLNLYPLRAPTKPHDNSIASDWFTNMLSDAGLSINKFAINDSFQASDVNAIINMLMTNVYNRHHSNYVWSIVVEEEDDYSLTSANFAYYMENVLNVLELTLPRYLPLFVQNKKYSLDPVAPIESHSSGSTRFNDTPQDSGDFSDDSHTTNISQSESAQIVDVGSIMSRLEELFKNFRSVLLEWSNEFNRVFLKEEQL